MIPGMDEDAPARPAPGEVVVDFDKINELKFRKNKETWFGALW